MTIIGHKGENNKKGRKERKRAIQDKCGERKREETEKQSDR